MQLKDSNRFHRLSEIASLALAALLILSIGSVTTAQGNEKRDVKVVVSQSKAVIESESETGGKEDELKIEFDNGSHNFTLEYESEDAGSDLEAKIKVELFDLIEWRDVNDNGLYDPDLSEEMVQKIGLGDLVSQSLTSQSTSVEGVDGVRIVGVTSAPEKYPDLSMTLTVQMYGEFLEIAGTSLEPTSMKFDIEISGFPYQQDDTALALYSKAEMVAVEDAE